MNPLNYSPEHPNYVPHVIRKVRNKEMVFYTPNNRLKIDSEVFESIEPDQLDWIEKIAQEPGTILYDIGASTGSFVAYGALCGLQVVAFEPEAHNFAALEMHHYLNSPNIKFPVIGLMSAVSDQAGIGKIFIRDNVQGTHLKILDRPKKVLENETFDFKHVQHVLKDSLDGFIERYGLPKPQYIKIDVDGHEEELLKGAQKTFASPCLKGIFIEIAHPEQKGKAIIQKILSYGFKEATRTKVQNYDGLYNYQFIKN